MKLLSIFCLLAASLAAEVPGDWPRWRGPFDTGVARGDAPVEWSATQNVAWKMELPGSGHSSPVIWGEKLFLTTAIPAQGGGFEQGGGDGGFGRGATGEQPEHRLVLMCIDRGSGKVLWERTARTVKPHEGFHRRYGSYASNSPVTDGKRVFAFFGSNGIYAYDLQGKLLWSRDSGIQMRMRNAFGEGTAAVLDGNTLLLNFDHEGDSFLWALNATDGKTLWKVDRDEPSNWSAPLVVEHNDVRQVIIAAPNKVRSYDLRNGELLWECAGLGLNTIPAPVHADGIVYVMSGFRIYSLLAIRLGGKGDITGTGQVVWTANRGTSYTASPVLADGKIYMLMDNGMLSCLDAKTGKPYYQQVRLPKPYNFKASPVAAGGKLYLASEDEDVIVVKMDEKFEVLATNTMADQSFVATPAVADGMFISGVEPTYLQSEIRSN